jgi:MraZ protein
VGEKVAYAVYRSSYQLTIDEKNRLLIPAAIRKAMNTEVDGDGFYIKLEVPGQLWLYGKKYYDMMASQQSASMNPGIETQDFNRRNFALVDELDWDKQGRVVVPDGLLKRAGVTKDVSLVGARDHLELWNRCDWDKYQEELYAEIAAKAEKERQARQVSTGG